MEIELIDKKFGLLETKIGLLEATSEQDSGNWGPPFVKLTVSMVWSFAIQTRTHISRVLGDTITYGVTTIHDFESSQRRRVSPEISSANSQTKLSR